MATRRTKVGWRKRMPRTVAERRKLPARCFLEPSRRKYPICNRAGRVDCGGAKAAFARARQQGRDALARKAVRAACRKRCAWTKRAERCPA